MEPRFAFTAQYWGNSAVVCRAVEDRPGPVVEQQFGEFPTWTQADAFAVKLNDGLDLDPVDAQQIVISSLLATAKVVQETLNSSSLWACSKVEVEARSAQLRCVLAELCLALTFCRTMMYLPEASVRRFALQVRRVARDVRRFLKLFDGDYDELQEIARRVESLNTTLQDITGYLESGKLSTASVEART